MGTKKTKRLSFDLPFDFTGLDKAEVSSDILQIFPYYDTTDAKLRTMELKDDKEPKDYRS